MGALSHGESVFMFGPPDTEGDTSKGAFPRRIADIDQPRAQPCGPVLEFAPDGVGEAVAVGSEQDGVFGKRGIGRMKKPRVTKCRNPVPTVQ